MTKVLSLDEIERAQANPIEAIFGYNAMGVRTDHWTKEYINRLLHTAREYHRLREVLQKVDSHFEHLPLDRALWCSALAREALKESEGAG